MQNLINDPWLPVRRRSGALDIVRPSDLTDRWDDDPIVDLAFRRPDWNAAVTELLIGLHAVAMPIADVAAWLGRWRKPPSPGEVAAAMEPLAFAYDLMGEGPRCFQDLDPLDGADPLPIQQIGMDAPGGNTVKLNQDLFIRRKTGNLPLPWPDAAAALVTLQTYAPSGGAGYRTSMRGGGPLTTLVRPRRSDEETRLFDTIIANQPRGVANRPLDARLFPWLAPTKTSRKGEVVVPEDMHSLHVFFGMPWRVRLEGHEDGAVSMRKVPYGTKYPSEAWSHPLSPYYQEKENWLPFHPQPGEPSFGDWPTTLGLGATRRPANCITAFEDIFEGEQMDADIIAFGFDMDNAKARAWNEARVPLVLGETARLRAETMITAAAEAASALRYAVKSVVYGQARENDGVVDLYIPDTVPKSALSELATELEKRTEGVLSALIRAVSRRDALPDPFYEAWHRELRGTALRLFDRETDIKNASLDELARIVRARGRLARAFSPKGKVAAALGISERLKASAAEARSQEKRDVA